jgi:AMP-binding enzyme C-terminal domain
MAADWMASGFAFTPGDVDRLAEDVLQRAAWSRWHSGARAVDLLDDREPRPAQALPLDEGFAVIEAPTGTGKGHPAVAEVCVVGKPDPERTEIVKAFAVLRQGFSPSAELGTLSISNGPMR